MAGPTVRQGRTRVAIRPPVLADATDFVVAARRSRSLHHPWVTAPATPAAFSTYLARMQPPSNRPFLVCHRETGALIGVINISNIVMGLFRSAYLGYYAFAGCERHGFMREGLHLVMRTAFRDLGLHRLEANIQPGNVASLALVRACGFSKEGFSPRYLKINGRWRDHERWAVRAD